MNIYHCCNSKKHLIHLQVYVCCNLLVYIRRTLEVFYEYFFVAITNKRKLHVIPGLYKTFSVLEVFVFKLFNIQTNKFYKAFLQLW